MWETLLWCCWALSSTIYTVVTFKNYTSGGDIRVPISVCGNTYWHIFLSSGVNIHSSLYPNNSSISAAELVGSKLFGMVPYCNVQTWRTFWHVGIVLIKQGNYNIDSNIVPDLPVGHRNWKWPKCSGLCALSNEMSPPIQYRSWTSLSDSSELNLSALLSAYIFLTKRHSKNTIFAPSLNIALWNGVKK